MLNRAVLVGRLTKDPELRLTPSGVQVANFTLAVNRTFTNQNGEREADFINIVVWRKQAENVAKYLKKGSLAGVDGRIQTRSYDGQDGKRVYVTEIVADSVQFLEPRGSSGANDFDQSFPSPPGFGYGDPMTSAGNANFQRSQNQPMGGGFSKMDEDPFADDGQPIDISDDDLPF